MPVTCGESEGDDSAGRSLMLRATAAATIVAAVPTKAALGPALSPLWRSAYPRPRAQESA